MKIYDDIRDMDFVTGDLVKKLNFINPHTQYVFRKFYRSGLRSHIFEILQAEDVYKESAGVRIDGVTVFPRAAPVKMLRILRNRFDCCEDTLKEIEKYRVLLKWLGKDLIASSQEFIVDYRVSGKSSILLCGLQEYVQGKVLDPWRMFDVDCFNDLFQSAGSGPCEDPVCQKAKKSLARFISRVRKMIDATGFIPDLAGNGNLIITPSGYVKLVDINNIVKLSLDSSIPIDDKGYPSCDVSVQVLSILENTVLETKIDPGDPLYRHFLDPLRKQAVKKLEKAFYKKINT